MIKGRVPERYLGLHRPAWKAVSALLHEHDVAAPLSVKMLYGWRSRLHALAWQMRPSGSTQQANVSMFVCGFWRSGTTLLHECLVRAANQWRAPSTQECMNPGQPQIGNASGSQKRPMDNLRIDSASPQEDEFALLALGASSFYRALLCPRSWPRLLSDLEAEPTVQEWVDREQKLHQFLGYLQAQDPRPLILKSPTHSFHLPRLLELFPDARAVIVVRDWAAVWASCQRMWRAMFELYAIGPWNAQDIADMATATYQAYSRQLALQSSRLPSARVTAIRYEDLARSPVDTLCALAARSGWRCDQANVESIRQFVADTRPDGGSTSELAAKLDSARRAELAACYRSVCDSVARFLVAPAS